MASNTANMTIVLYLSSNTSTNRNVPFLQLQPLASTISKSLPYSSYQSALTNSKACACSYVNRLLLRSVSVSGLVRAAFRLHNPSADDASASSHVVGSWTLSSPAKHEAITQRGVVCVGRPSAPTHSENSSTVCASRVPLAVLRVSGETSALIRLSQAVSVARRAASHQPPACTTAAVSCSYPISSIPSPVQARRTGAPRARAFASHISI